MATIILGSVGKMFGPVGQIVGTLAGSAIDNAIFGSNDIEGARLKELAVTGSSYGTPIARQFGTMRVPGTIIWSTDLKEHREKQSNGKGKPKTVTYSYSVSFAVALSSGPIDGIGRIWADGNLLRGAGGDLKSAGQLRIYKGHADQPRDPLLEAVLGNECPAFRGRAYAVFEDLDLTDFGNRIPALSFELIAGDAATIVETMLGERGISVGKGARFGELSGFAHEGGTLRDTVQLIDRLHPLSPGIGDEGFSLEGANGPHGEAAELPAPATWEDGDFGIQSGSAKQRSDGSSDRFAALRYYDPARDYQPGLQHTPTSDAGTRIFQFPGALSAADARSIAERASHRASVRRDTMSWRCTELDPALRPGSLVTAPGHAGTWQVASWEWRERGIELELVRYRADSLAGIKADPGTGFVLPDRRASQTVLRVFETPWDGSGSSSERRAFVAASAAAGRWSGCSLYAERVGGLLPLGHAATERAISGQTISALPPSSATRFEPAASFDIQLVDHEAELQPSDIHGLAQGDNRLLVGKEVLQFCDAEPLGEGRWRLSGLLRGRGGTEIDAGAGHAIGASATLLDDRLLLLDEQAINSAAGSFAAIGLWDERPVPALLENPGASQRPPCPVHPRIERATDGSIRLSWIRRARGQWSWNDDVDQPLVEEAEIYEIGIGPLDAPLASWSARSPELLLDAPIVADLLAEHGNAAIWVRQSGSFAHSRALLLGHL